MNAVAWKTLARLEGEDAVGVEHQLPAGAGAAGIAAELAGAAGGFRQE